MSNVKTALRVRPLSERELGDDTIVSVEDEKTVAVTNLKVSSHHAGDSRERTKTFGFDFCFDSSSPGKNNYATQEHLFDNLGKIILEAFARGQDACVLAYGQSASGKTHTMQGTEEDPGLAPRLCEAIQETSVAENAKLSLSFFEIYNERVRDLLTNVAVGSLKQEKEFVGECLQAEQTKVLRVREHPRKGPYVEGLSEVSVCTKEDISTLLRTASSRRKTAATQRNPESSRSHAVLVLKRDKPWTTLTLLDLAGSERPSRVNQSISHQKEGSNINKSLVALSNVISTLAEASPRASRYVPYRDSVLTWLLKDTLSGGAPTIMVATVSPASSCYAETVNTMRWTSRAGRIQAGAGSGGRPPKTAAQRSLRALRAEVARLRELLLNVSYKEKIAKDPVQVVHQTTQVSFSSRRDDDRKEEGHDTEVCVIKEENSHSDENKELEGEDSFNSLASSRLSVISNETFSNPSNHGSNLHQGPTEDALFGPRLNRTNSVHDMKPLPPLRNKNKQYNSHEGLANPDVRSSKTPLVRLNKNAINRIGDKEKVENFATDCRKDETKLNIDTQKHVPYEYFNKRANIVASVTDRLYGLSKKKEEVDKMGGVSRSDSKANGTKKRLFDISYRALRASRRFRFGVPAETQTEQSSAVRVKEAGNDIQQDIEPLPFSIDETGKKFRNASVETESHTLLCKEVSVETINGSIKSDDKNVATEKHDGFGNIVFTKTCGNMTENKCTYSVSTQTCEVPPPRRKYSSFTKYLKVKKDNLPPSTSNERLTPNVFNISISHDCNQLENEGDSISDDSLEYDNKLHDSKLQSHATPDLLNNHNSNENITNRNSEGPINAPKKSHNENSSQTLSYEFNDRQQNSFERHLYVNVDSFNDIKQRSNSEATNSNIIKSKTSVDINDRCDRVTNTEEEVIKEHDVTWNALQPSVILNADTIKLNNNNAMEDDKMNCENYQLCTSKSTQVDSVGDSRILVDFLEDVYVPLPRICVTSDFSVDRWPSMRDIILGRNQNSYPYNIKLSPKKEETGIRKRSKSVSWKIDKHEKDSMPKNNPRRSLLKRTHTSSKLNSSHFATTPLVVKHYDYVENDRQIDDYTYHDHKKYLYKNSHFHGIGAWEDRNTPNTNKNQCQSRKSDLRTDYKTHFDSTCRQYVNATSNLIKDATELVDKLDKYNALKRNEESENNLDANISQDCNDILQDIDENSNRNTLLLEGESSPSTSTSFEFKQNITNSESDPLIVNDELICSDDNDSDECSCSDEDVGFTNDEDLMAVSKNIDDLEKDMFLSIDRLDAYTKKSSEYFVKLPRRYSERYDRKLTSCYDGPIPFPRIKKNPSKYLEELLKIRKDLVECTKRDDFICSRFQKEFYC